MAKRNIPDEIQSLKSRKEFESYWKIDQKLDKIQTCIEDLGKITGSSKEELSKYIPVALVATMESFMRSTIAKLINSNHAYLLNAKKIFDGKFEFEVFTKLHKREFTIGEFISHTISFGKFEHIASNFDSVLDEDFMSKLKAYSVTTVYSGFQGPHPKDFAPNYDKIVANVRRVLELRHIICHEMSHKLLITDEEIKAGFKSVKALIYQIYNYTYSIMFPDSLLDNADLLKSSKGKYDKAMLRLNGVLEKIDAHPYTSFEAKLDVNLFKESQDLWGKFIEKYATSLYKVFGGEVYQSLVLDELTSMIEDRADDLETEFVFERD